MSASARDLGATLGTRIRERREALGWSQAELAEAAGVTPNYVGVLERGEKLPALETLAAVAEAMRVSMGALLSDETPDAWADSTAALIRVVPVEHRGLVIAFLKAVGSNAAQRKSSRARYAPAAGTATTLPVTESRRRRTK